MPTIADSITKTLLESEYDLLGYTAMKVHDNDAKIKYGKYKLPLYDGPIFVEDMRTEEMNGGYITFTIGEPDEVV